MSQAKKGKRWGNRRALNALIWCLVVLAILLAALAAWRRRSQRRLPVDRPSELGDIVDQRIDVAMSNIGFAGPARLPQSLAPTCSFVCPQCRSRCWTQPGGGYPACPFCGRTMAREGLGMSLVGRAPAERLSAVPGTAQAGALSAPALPVAAVRPHGDRGVCNGCHTAILFDASSPALTPAVARQCPPGAYWQGAAAPATPDAIKPVLIKEFGIEIRPAPGAGVAVTGVMGNSYASNAGMRAGDIIVECNGTEIRGVESFRQLVSQAAPETDAQITALRNGRTRDFLVMVGEGEMEGFGPIQRP